MDVCTLVEGLVVTQLVTLDIAALVAESYDPLPKESDAPSKAGEYHPSP